MAAGSLSVCEFELGGHLEPGEPDTKNVPGVLDEGNLIPKLTLDEAHGLITSGVVYGGMIPKVQAAIYAVQQGVKRTRIVNLAGLLKETGTVFSNG